MNLVDPANLPASTTDGPEDWGTAMTKLATTTSTAQQLIENTNSDRTILENIYDRRIKTIADLTGQTLQNPIHSLPGVPAFLQPRDRPLYGQYEQQFAKQAQAIADQHPELGPQFQSLTSGVDDEMKRMQRDAEAAVGAASNDPTLDPISGFAAKMAGGLAGAARDPFQWQMAVMGGGSSGGATVAARIGKTMLQEGLLNGGQEAVLQAASQDRKKAAGLEYGMKDALTNVGVAATFGALFGGSIEGGHALAKIYHMGDGGAEAAARVIDGAPQPGDVEMVAKAMNVDLHPDQITMVNRSFEDKSLDETFFPDDTTPEHGRVVEAALRHAEDPDLNPPPEIVERAIADEQAGPTKFLTADDYERIYGGDPDAIDDLHNVMQSEALGDARIIDDQTRSPSEETVAPDVPAEPAAAAAAVDPYIAAGERFADHPIKDLADKSVPDRVFHGTSKGEFDEFDPYRGEYGLMGSGSYFTENPHIALEYTKKGKGTSPAVYTTKIEARNPLDMDGPADAEAWQKAFGENLPNEDFDGNPINYEGKTNEQMYREVEEALSQDMIPRWEGAEIMQDGMRSMGHDSVTHIGGGRHKASKDVNHRVWIVFDPEQARVLGRDFIRAEPEPVVSEPARAAIAQADPLEGQTIKPDVTAEPVDDAAMRSAEEQAGEIREPEFDENGNPRSLLDFIPMQDRDGNFRLVSTAQALEMADRGGHLADLLEACKL